MVALLGGTVLSGVLGGLPYPFGSGIPLSSEHAKSSGPSRPFAEVWDVARKEATRIDKDAVLSYVDASTVGKIAGVAYSGPVTGSLKVTITYVRPNGDDITVDVEDADPASTVQTAFHNISSVSDGPKRYQDIKDRSTDFEQLLRSYKLTPRDAVSKTWDDVQKYAIVKGLQPDHVLPLITTGRSKTDVPIWKVDYWYELPKSSVSLGEIFDLPPAVAYYTVDGLTGEVLKIEHQTIEPTITPHTANR
jgi:hypothetical protein